VGRGGVEAEAQRDGVGAECLAMQRPLPVAEALGVDLLFVPLDDLPSLLQYVFIRPGDGHLARLGSQATEPEAGAAAGQFLQVAADRLALLRRAQRGRPALRSAPEVTPHPLAGCARPELF